MKILDAHLINLFGCNPATAQSIAEKFTQANIAKGEYFQRQGAWCDKLGFIASGIFREYITIDGKDITKWIGISGYFITDISAFMFGTQARSSLQALTDCNMMIINRNDYLTLNQLIPEWDVIEKKFLVRCFATMEDRVVSFIALTAEERYQALFNAQPDLFNQIPLQYLASMLGMTSETLSRIRRKLTP